jgi:hypothetical protein
MIKSAKIWLVAGAAQKTAAVQHGVDAWKGSPEATDFVE